MYGSDIHPSSFANVMTCRPLSYARSRILKKSSQLVINSLLSFLSYIILSCCMLLLNHIILYTLGHFVSHVYYLDSFMHEFQLRVCSSIVSAIRYPGQSFFITFNPVHKLFLLFSLFTLVPLTIYTHFQLLHTHYTQHEPTVHVFLVELYSSHSLGTYISMSHSLQINCNSRSFLSFKLFTTHLSFFGARPRWFLWEPFCYIIKNG